MHTRTRCTTTRHGVPIFCTYLLSSMVDSNQSPKDSHLLFTDFKSCRGMCLMCNTILSSESSKLTYLIYFPLSVQRHFQRNKNTCQFISMLWLKASFPDLQGSQAAGCKHRFCLFAIILSKTGFDKLMEWLIEKELYIICLASTWINYSLDVVRFLHLLSNKGFLM